jgi:hypothetical protein
MPFEFAQMISDDLNCIQRYAKFIKVQTLQDVASINQGIQTEECS